MKSVQSVIKVPAIHALVSASLGRSWNRVSLAFSLIVVAWLGLAGPAQGQTSGYAISTFAGIGGSAGYFDGTGGSIGLPIFNGPIGIVIAANGDLYVTDVGNYVVRTVTQAGVVTTLAGTATLPGTADGTGTAATFNAAIGPALDSKGNIFVAEYNANTIRKITPAGVVSTFAGTAGAIGATDATGSLASFNGPTSVAIDSDDNLYVTDSGSHTIRRITSAGVVTTLAGSAGVLGTADGTTTAARFYNPRGIVADKANKILYVADTGSNTIRKITLADGAVTTFAGTPATFGHVDATGTDARFSIPYGLAVDGSGNLIIAEQGTNSIRKITPAGVVTTLAGSLTTELGAVDGTGSAARFDHPSGVTVDASGNIFVADYFNGLIRKITPSGTVTTIAGVAGGRDYQDGTGYILDPAFFRNLSGVTLDGAGNIYVADTGNHTIRKVTPNGVVMTLAGNPTIAGTVDGTGTAANFNAPSGVASDSVGNVYVADTNNHTIRKVTTGGVVTTIAGTVGVSGSANGTALAATFSFPSGVAVDGSGNVYVADYGNNTIRMITQAGVVTTLAGTAGNAGNANGVGTAALFNHPRDVAVDAGGNVYVADSGNHVVRKIAPGGMVVTLAGTAGSAGTTDGAGTTAKFDGLSGVAVDSSGNVYVADTNSSTIRLVNSAGVVSTLGGVAGSAGNVDGVGTAAKFNHPTGVAVDTAGNFYVADARNQTLRLGVPPGGTPPGGGSGGSGGTGSGGTGSGGTGSGGTGSGGTGGTGGTGSGGTGTGFLLHPGGITSDALAVLYVTDTANNCIKKIAVDGTVTVFAGKSGTSGSNDGTGTAALFNGPTGITIDSSSNLYVSDTGNATIRKITSAGVVTTFAGKAGSHGNTDGTGNAALFSSPSGLTGDSAGNLYVADSVACTIRMITPTAVVTTFAGKAATPGSTDGVGTAALFNNPTGLATGTNFIYVADTYNNTIRKILTAAIPAVTDATTGAVTFPAIPNATVTTLAGSAGISGSYDGTGIFGLFNLPQGVAAASAGVYVADTGNNTIRTVSDSGKVTTLAGIPGIVGSRDGSGVTALFNQPQALASLSSSLVIADTGNSVIRTVNSSLTVATRSLKDPTDTTVTAPSTGGGGGGAVEPWMAAALLLLFGFARKSAAGRRW